MNLQHNPQDFRKPSHSFDTTQPYFSLPRNKQKIVQINNQPPNPIINNSQSVALTESHDNQIIQSTIKTSQLSDRTNRRSTLPRIFFTYNITPRSVSIPVQNVETVFVQNTSFQKNVVVNNESSIVHTQNKTVLVDNKLDINRFLRQNEQLKVTIKNLMIKFQTLRITQSDYLQKISHLQTRLLQVSTDSARLQQQFNIINNKLRQVQLQKQKYQQFIRQSNSKDDRQVLINQIQHLQLQIQQFQSTQQSLSTSTQQHKYQTVTEQHQQYQRLIEQYRSTLLIKEQQIKTLRQRFESNQQIFRLTQINSKLQQNIVSIQKQANQYIAYQKTVIQNLQKSNKQLLSFKEIASNKNINTQTSSQVVSLQQRITQLTTENQQLSQTHIQFQQQLNFLRQKSSHLEQQLFVCKQIITKYQAEHQIISTQYNQLLNQNHQLTIHHQNCSNGNSTFNIQFQRSILLQIEAISQDKEQLVHQIKQCVNRGLLNLQSNRRT